MKRFLSVILCFVLLFSASMVSADETTVKMWSVRFWACTSESHEQFVVKEEWVPDGGSATPPSSVYVPEGYTFEGWIQSYSNITNHTSINANYQPIYVVPTRPPTATPAPTNTPTPTATPAPTNTPAPTAANTPTNTPTPTATPTPTETPAPNNTPTPTRTSESQPTVIVAQSDISSDTSVTSVSVTESSLIMSTEVTDGTAMDSETPEQKDTTVPETASAVSETERSGTGNDKEEPADSGFNPAILVWITVAILIVTSIVLFVWLRRKKKE